MTLMIFHRVLIATAIVFLLAYGAFEILADSSTQGRTGPPDTPGADLPTGLERGGSAEGNGALFTGLGLIAGGLVLSGYFVWLIRQPLPPRDDPAVV